MDGYGVVAIVVMSATVAWAVQVLGFGPAARTMKATGGVGIVGMEFLWSRERAAAVLHRWGTVGRRAAVQSLWWDFLFIASYGSGGFVLALSIASHARDGRGSPGWGTLALVGAWGVVVAAVLDVVENVALLLLLRRSDHGGDSGIAAGGVNLPLVASVAALAKWLLVAVSVVAVVTVALLFVAAP